jgi:lipid II:glycine glycyltransferase (peptidoglycan interpeptide bridge formation enzyme)
MELFYLSDSTEDQKKVTDFIKENSSEGGAEFLQSYEWGNFLKLSGEEIIRVGVKEGENILLITTLVKKIIFKGFFYLYAPRGPIGSVKAIEFLFSEIKKKYPTALFLRVEPLKINSLEFKTFKNNLQKTIDLQPAKTLILDLNYSEEELLNLMHQKTRYNIRLAQKKGVVIKEGKGDDLKEFWRLLKTTGERDGFRLHSFSHYEKLLKINETSPGFIKLFLASYEGKNIAAGLFSYYGDKVTYLHGASDNEFRNLMAPYLLQFSLIKKAREENYLYYDFYGIDEKKWPGVTRFKLGYGGRVFEYLGTHDLIFKTSLYKFYQLIRKLRRLI